MGAALVVEELEGVVQERRRHPLRRHRDLLDELAEWRLALAPRRLGPSRMAR
jgi:hypothetical protein